VTRAARTRILVDGSDALRSRLAGEASAACDIHEVEGPTESLVMLTARDTARGALFHPGELLVTEARARIGDCIGLGIAAGSCPRKAWELAVIDAAFNAHLPLTEAWVTLLEQEGRRLKAEQEREESRILETRVDFQTMDLT
jgi:alpha-D-ribose 1-methylphosphonate 5-triphosphate synthase subunit PhnG